MSGWRSSGLVAALSSIQDMMGKKMPSRLRPLQLESGLAGVGLQTADHMSLLQKARFAGDFLQREAKAEGAGGHFWHDEVLTQTP